MFDQISLGFLSSKLQKRTSISFSPLHQFLTLLPYLLPANSLLSHGPNEHEENSHIKITKTGFKHKISAPITY